MVTPSQVVGSQKLLLSTCFYRWKPTFRNRTETILIDRWPTGGLERHVRHAPVFRHWCQVPGSRSETPCSRKRPRNGEGQHKKTRRMLMSTTTYSTRVGRTTGKSPGSERSQEVGTCRGRPVGVGKCCVPVYEGPSLPKETMATELQPQHL